MAADMDMLDLVEMAKMAEQTERYEDMVEYMTEFTKKAEKLSDEERNLLSVAFKNVVGCRRSAWRIISNIQSKGMNPDYSESYKGEIEKELNEKCEAVLKLIDDHLIKDPADSVDANVFYLKMKGDYFRYLVEVTTGEKRDELANKSKDAYTDALEASSELSTTHPIKLGLALNFSVFHYEIMGDGPKAVSIAKNAFDEAIKELDNLKEDSYKDSTLIMQLLRDNLTLWTSEADDEGEGEA